MSLLLTPVALICPLFNNGNDIPKPMDLAAMHEPITQCRVMRGEKGMSYLSFDNNHIAIYPIHYVTGEKPHIIFATQLMSGDDNVHLDMWSGNLYDNRINSDQQHVIYSKNELQLVSINLQADLDLHNDHLCIGFNAMQQDPVQMRLSISQHVS